MNRKMRIEIGSNLFRALTATMENNNPFLYEGRPHDVIDIKRIERTDFVEVELKQC